ncbi:MAG: hypothetical protein MUE72_11095 [Chitinophagaceae bacterium]|jgi:hypothetical protein|nr:hypothetical protein [Chitinophagaceae bacterium]
MKKIAPIFFTLFSLQLTAQTATDIIGKWKGEDKQNNHIEILLGNDGLYYGKLIYEDGKKENLYKQTMRNLIYDVTSKMYKGIMSPPDKDIELNVTISFVDKNKLKLVAKKLFITKTIYFLRIQ